LYKLDLFYKWQSEEELDDKEAADLKAFKQRRHGESNWEGAGKGGTWWEFQALLYRWDNGEEVEDEDCLKDEDCLCCLELYACQHLEEGLEGKLMEDLEDFET
jgi:hypothetical protein